jgi:hypothetical protein
MTSLPSSERYGRLIIIAFVCSRRFYMRIICVVLATAAVFLSLSCGSHPGAVDLGPLVVNGTVWTMDQAQENRTVVSQNPKRSSYAVYTDSVGIAEAGMGFGYLNYLAFPDTAYFDSLKIYGSTVPDTFFGPYAVNGNSISAAVYMFDTTVDLEFVRTITDRLTLDFPAIEVSYHMPGMGMAFSQVFANTQERDDYIATLDTAFHPATMDSIVYRTVSYSYTRRPGIQ